MSSITISTGKWVIFFGLYHILFLVSKNAHKIIGSHGTLLGTINAFVHVIMYGYYFLTSYRPELKNSLWWKKHITQIQLVSEQRAHIYTSFFALFVGFNLNCKYFAPLKINDFQFMHCNFNDFFSYFFVWFSIVDPIRNFGRSLFESDFILRMRMVKGNFTHWCHTEYVHVHTVFRLLHQSLHTETAKGAEQMNPRLIGMAFIRSLLMFCFIHIFRFHWNIIQQTVCVLGLSSIQTTNEIVFQDR